MTFIKLYLQTSGVTKRMRYEKSYIM